MGGSVGSTLYPTFPITVTGSGKTAYHGHGYVFPSLLVCIRLLHVYVDLWNDPFLARQRAL